MDTLLTFTNIDCGKDVADVTNGLYNQTVSVRGNYSHPYFIASKQRFDLLLDPKNE
jgi:hypothetical protein